MLDKKNNDKIMVFLISFLVGLFFFWGHSRPGMLGSRLDIVILLFGFVLPFILCLGLVKYDMEDKV